jgi:hypothetical protein
MAGMFIEGIGGMTDTIRMSTSVTGSPPLSVARTSTTLSPARGGSGENPTVISKAFRAGCSGSGADVAL